MINELPVPPPPSPRTPPPRRRGVFAALGVAGVALVLGTACKTPSEHHSAPPPKPSHTHTVAPPVPVVTKTYTAPPVKKPCPPTSVKTTLTSKPMPAPSTSTTPPSPPVVKTTVVPPPVQTATPEAAKVPMPPVTVTQAPVLPNTGTNDTPQLVAWAGGLLAAGLGLLGGAWSLRRRWS